MSSQRLKLLKNKSLVLLIAIGAMLLVAVASALWSLYIQQQSSVFAVRENAVWATQQLDREVAKFEVATALFYGRRPGTGVDQLTERFDVLYSRVDVINQTLLKNGFFEHPMIERLARESTDIIASMVPLVDSFAGRTTIEPAELNPLLESLDRLRPVTESLVLFTNRRQGEGNLRQREEFSFLCRVLAGAFGAFTLTMFAALVAMAQQMRQIERARARSEALSQELKIAAHAAEVGNVAKSVFLATMSHEIRTPLNGVIGMVELLEESELTQAQLEKVRSIRDCGTALVELVNDVLDFSKLESGNIDLEHRPFQLGDIVEGVTELVAARARERKLSLIALYPDVEIAGDQTRLRQILLNLVGNAVKFTAAGSVILRASEILADDGRRLLQFDVEDTGIGISVEAQSRLFTEFTQVDASINRSHGGTGLGLAICRRLVTAMGGEIGLVSAPGTGSRFWFTLPIDAPSSRQVHLKSEPEPAALSLLAATTPVAQSLAAELSAAGYAVQVGRPGEPGLPGSRVLIAADVLRTMTAEEIDALPPERIVFGFGADALADRAAITCDGALTTRRLSALLRPRGGTQSGSRPFAAGPANAAVLRPARILVAEDNLVNQRVARELLQRMGHTVVIADNGELAVAAAASETFDLILMDMQMPIMDGLEATRRIRALDGPQGSVTIVGLTANAFASDRDACFKAGMNGFLTKPVTRAKLNDGLTPWLKGNEEGNMEPALIAPASAGAGAPGKPLLDVRQRGQLAEELGWDVIDELTQSFWSDADVLMREAHDAIARNARTELAEILHTIKGSALNLGLARIGAETEALRAVVRSTRVPDLTALQQAMTATRQRTLEPDIAVAVSDAAATAA